MPSFTAFARRFAVHFTIVAALAGVAGCASTTSGGGDPDMAVCDGFACTGGCDTDNDCKDGKKCDPMKHLCVSCVGDGDCPIGQLCNPRTGLCAAGCSGMRTCSPDGGVCETDAGLCVECIADGDCKDPGKPRCDPEAQRCQGCLPSSDNCGWGQYCMPQNGNFVCVGGCKDDTDCVPVRADGGPGDGDGGPGDSDGGGNGDGGGNPDGGGGGNGLAYCNQMIHACVQCTRDDQCPLGKLCKANACVDGCNAMHGCAGGLTCCGEQCTDITNDFANCGMCGTACPGGWFCCNAICANPTNDAQHCGSCGNECKVDNGNGACGQRMCGVGKCNPGFADCNGVYPDGCETNTNQNVNHCGGCNQACAIPRAAPKCLGGKCEIDTCLAPWQDCNGMVMDGCETNVQSTDVMNCGACNAVCKTPNGQPSCVAGACKIASCNPGFADCNKDPVDGCEIDLQNDVAHCGGCGMVCKPQNGAPRCAAGKCEVDMCGGGFADCDLDPKNGCEINLTNDVSNCGQCRKVCSNANGSPSCKGSACEIACFNGFADCNMSAADGCEINLNSDVTNCGGCGNVCNLPNARPACAAGACQIASCNAGWADCDRDPKNGCEVNIAADANNCGSCGKACSRANGAASCVAAACEIKCNPGFDSCDGDIANGCETNLNTSLASCGSCGKSCNLPRATPQCVGGACGVATCEAGWADCDKIAANGCEIQVSADANNCGACGKVCSSQNGAPACGNGVCSITCNGGFGNCNNDASDGCEINFNTDVANCSGCGRACVLANATPSCQLGACKVSACDAGFSDCNNIPTDGCEVNLTSDVKNCGGCGAACSSNNGAPNCVNRVCSIACGNGFANCNMNVADGCEINTQNDILHCGACGAKCSSNNGTPSCGAGACSVACNNGFGNCNNSAADGCEVDLDTTLAHCGGCGRACALANASEQCVAGACKILQCDAGYADCNGNPADGCEVNLTNTVAHCGACNAACSNNNGTPSCVASKCEVNCTAGFADCNMNVADGCEVNINTSASHCGQCGKVCSNNNIANPTCGGGVCNGACNNGTADCNGNKQADGCEIVLGNDANNCGGCNTGCSANNIARACVNGGCETGVCANGFADCNNNKRADGCEVGLNNDLANCGGCGQGCSSNNINRACVAGGCETGTCTAGNADCNMNKRADGCEIAINTDVNNCGGCGQACSGSNITRACNGGSCENGTCNGGFADCDMNKRGNGCEVNLNGDPANCGGCGQGCSQANINRTCTAGSCTGVCNAGFLDCNNDKRVDGCERNVYTDANNCGGCGVICSNSNMASRTCAAPGTCNGGCNAGFADCNGNKQTDGCEVNTNTNVNNCGGCGSNCVLDNATPGCVGGACTINACNAGWGNCDNMAPNGCETNVLNNNTHCGACNSLCARANASAACQNGSCVLGTCNAGFTNLDNNPANGCECAIPTTGLVCNAPSAIGTLNVGQSAMASSKVVGPVTELWYTVTFTGNTDPGYHPRVRFSVNPNNAYVFDLRADCNAQQSNYNCPGGGLADGRTDWDTFYSGVTNGVFNPNAPDFQSPGFQPIVPVFNNGTTFIRVRRNPNVAAPQACADVYTLVVSNL